MSPEMEKEVRGEAIRRLDEISANLRARLATSNLHILAWEDMEDYLSAKNGRGTLMLHRPENCLLPATYPGVHYTSSQGPNSDNSYSGFLPGVTLEEAKLLVKGEYLRICKR